MKYISPYVKLDLASPTVPSSSLPDMTCVNGTR